jgi:hypothetical protein
VFAIQHKTNPSHEFGEIKMDSDMSSPRFIYQLLNPADEDVLTVLASEKRELKVYTRGEGVSLDVRRAGDGGSASWYWFLLTALSAVGGVIMETLFTLVSRLFRVDLRA